MRRIGFILLMLLILDLSLTYIQRECLGEIIWQENWDERPEWQSPAGEKIQGLNVTHTEAIQRFNASGYRLSSDISILEIAQMAGRGNSGNGLIYRFKGTGNWCAASIDLAFCDPDVSDAGRSKEKNL